MIAEETEFGKELEALLNKYSKENMSNTPDGILASFLEDCMNVWTIHVDMLDRHYGRKNLIDSLFPEYEGKHRKTDENTDLKIEGAHLEVNNKGVFMYA
jgi:hypothetical protein